MEKYDTTEPPTLCDRCPEYFSFLIVAFGRDLTEQEKKCNATLISEGKAEKCLAYERFFNKSFPKKREHCDEWESDPDFGETFDEE